MTLDELRAAFERHNDDFLKWDLVSPERASRPDLHAFLLLNDLVPDTRDMVSAAEHDEIFLAVTPEQLAAVATDAHVLELVRCGVRYDTYTDSLAMFV